MLGLDMLDVAIGVVFVFLLVSLIASAIAEIIESKLKYRSSDLERGIREMLKNDDTLVQQLYDHPIISSLFEGKYEKGKSTLPSYIPARSFALAMMDLLLPASDGSGAKGATPAAAGAVTDNAAKIVQISSEAMATLRNVAKKDNPDPKSVEQRLMNAPADVAKALVTMVDAANGDASKVRSNVENWFNTSMDRVSGWYKRRNHQILVLIGLVIAILFNIDTIAITQTLWTNRGVREASVAAASAFANKGMPTGGDPAKNMKEYQNALASLQLPIGWASENCPEGPSSSMTKISDRLQSRAWWACWLAAIPLHLIGWLITAAAVSMGAPFWFDTLNKIMVVRSTVKPHEKSSEEAPKERAAAAT